MHKNLISLKEAEKKEYFSQQLKQYKSQTSAIKSFLLPKNNITCASFQLSHCIARHGKNLSEGEFFKTALLECSESLFADFEEKDRIIKRIKELQASRNTVKDRILALDEDTSTQLICDLNSTEMYSISLDESTDITGQAHLAVIIRFKSGNIIKEELIKLMNLTGKTTGAEIMKEFTLNMTEMKIDLKKIVSVTTDGAPSMVGKNIGFINLLKPKIEHPLIEFHCIIHQEVLCAKKGLKPFDNVISIVTSVVNYISAQALNKREFSKLLEEVDFQYSGLLMYNNVRWLSYGQVLNRFVNLLDEIKIFLHKKEKIYPELANEEWLNNLMFLCDLTQHFNELNKKLQGRGQIALTMYENIKSFMIKIDIFITDLNSKTMKYFPCLKKYIETSVNLETNDKAIKQHLSCLEEIKTGFSERFNQFKQLETTIRFVISPHLIEYKSLELSFFNWLNIDNLEMELVEFQNSFIWRNKFIELNVELEKKAHEIEKKSIEEKVENIILQEWNSLPSSFEGMKRLATALLTMFGSTYACEQLFSSMNFIKSGLRNRLSKEMTAACVRLKTTNYAPRAEKLLSNKLQISH